MIAEAMAETFFSDAVEDTRQRLQPGEMAGWSDFVPFYDLVVEAAPPGSAIVEVGVFCGKSLIHLAKAAKAANKRLRIYGVDTFQGSPEFVGRVWFDDKPIHECHPATLVSECIANLTTHGVRNDVTLIVGDSAKSAELFADQGVFAVMIDAAHDEASVTKDIAAWFPKVCNGGYLAGDDWYGFPGVQAAVKNSFYDWSYTVQGCYWQVQK